MTRPDDFTPSNAIQVKDSQDTRAANRRVWIVRVLGVVIAVLGWLAVSLPHWGELAVATNGAVFAGLMTYAFAAAVLSRKQFVHLEKKLRLRLLVHNMELENMAMRDELTQLFNRRYFFDRLERELATAKGFERPLAVITIDLDSLREINKTHGYTAGDRALASFGQYLLDHTRATDVPARVGGDEFAIILPDTSKRGANTMMERLVTGLDKDPLVDEDDITMRVTTSLGMSGYPWGGDTLDAIMHQAEAELRSEKEARRGTPSALERDRDGRGSTVPAIFRKASADDREPAGSERAQT